MHRAMKRRYLRITPEQYQALAEICAWEGRRMGQTADAILTLGLAEYAKQVGRGEAEVAYIERQRPSMVVLTNGVTYERAREVTERELRLPAKDRRVMSSREVYEERTRAERIAARRSAAYQRKKADLAPPEALDFAQKMKETPLDYD